MIRRKYLFYGKVQEVGFRTTVMNMAVILHITGNIENQDDGSVIAYMQGKEKAIETMISYLSNYPPFDIISINYENQEVDLEETDFKLIDRYITR